MVRSKKEVHAPFRNKVFDTIKVDGDDAVGHSRCNFREEERGAVSLRECALGGVAAVFFSCVGRPLAVACWWAEGGLCRQAVRWRVLRGGRLEFSVR